MAKKMAAKKAVPPKPRCMWGVVDEKGDIFSWTIRHEKAESIAEYESGVLCDFDKSGCRCVKLHVEGVESSTKPKPPDCTSVGSSGTYHGNMMHPEQFEKLLTAIEGVKIDPRRVSFAHPPEFWANLTTSLTMALMAADTNNRQKFEHMAEEAQDAGKALLKRFKEGE